MVKSDVLAGVTMKEPTKTERTNAIKPTNKVSIGVSRRNTGRFYPARVPILLFRLGFGLFRERIADRGQKRRGVLQDSGGTRMIARRFLLVVRVKLRDRLSDGVYLADFVERSLKMACIHLTIAFFAQRVRRVHGNS